MTISINILANKFNNPAISFLAGKSAHSDVTDKLLESIYSLGDVNTFCPNPSQYEYIAAYTNKIIFAFAYGMDNIAFRENDLFKDRALQTGAFDLPELGNEWVYFKLFRNDWPEFDLKFWAQKAYVYARELSRKLQIEN